MTTTAQADADAHTPIKLIAHNELIYDIKLQGDLVGDIEFVWDEFTEAAHWTGRVLVDGTLTQLTVGAYEKGARGFPTPEAASLAVAWESLHRANTAEAGAQMVDTTTCAHSVSLDKPCRSRQQVCDEIDRQGAQFCSVGDQRVYIGSIAAYCYHLVTVIAAPCCQSCEHRGPGRVRVRAADGQTLRHVRSSSLLPAAAEGDASRYLTAARGLGADRIRMLRVVADPTTTVMWTVHSWVIRDYPTGAVEWALDALTDMSLIDRCPDGVIRVTDLGRAFLMALDTEEMA